MTWINSQISVDDAIQRQLDVWELLIDEWGNVANPSGDGTSLTFPALQHLALPTPAAIAIGPRSTVDRCWVTYNLQKIVEAQQTWDFTRRVSVGAPLLLSEPANRRVVQTSTDLDRMPSVQILPTNALGSYAPQIVDRTRFNNKYQKADGTLSTFGADAPGWISPLLHIYYYLRMPTLAPPTKRFPLTVQSNFDTVGNATEKLVAQIPICGRRTVVCGMSVTAQADIRLAVIENLSENVGAGSGVGGAMRENTVFTAPALGAGASARAVIEPANADYLMVYATFAAAAQSVYLRLRADDWNNHELR